MAVSSETIGDLVRQTRKQLGVTQKQLALTSGTGLRFIIDLEKGKSSCQLGKTLTVLQTLGVTLQFTVPAIIAPARPSTPPPGEL